MRKLKIVSDSSADLLKLEGAEFASSPMKIITAEREFVDDGHLDVDEMVSFMDQYQGRSQSSCPNPGDWLEAFGDADDVICVTITSGLSGSCNSAHTAKGIYEAEHEGSRVFVLDTLSAGPEITLVLRKLAELARSSMEYEEICAAIGEYLQQTGLVFMLKSLKNFANNGRVSPLVAKIVGLAGICVVGKASAEGTLEPTHKCRGEARSLVTLAEDLEQQGLKNGRVSIGHCQNEKAALRMKELLEERFSCEEIDIHPLRGLCSFYAEKGGLLIGFEKR